MATPEEPGELLERSLETDRIHSAYLLSGAGEAPRQAALRFARGMACQAETGRPCEACRSCQRSAEGEEGPLPLDGTGKRGPLYRHLGDHPDLLWIERGESDTRVRIGQVRALQGAFRLRGDGGRRAAVIADAEWLNQEAQNALLRLLEEPPPRTTLILVAGSSASLLATVRSRCQRVAFPAAEGFALDAPEHAELAQRLRDLSGYGAADVLDWADEFRGARAPAAAAVEELLAAGSELLRSRAAERVHAGGPPPRAEIRAFDELSSCRKTLAQRNANPQMVAERALFALRDSVTP